MFVSLSKALHVAFCASQWDLRLARAARANAIGDDERQADARSSS
jgi:hypothetical protein